MIGADGSAWAALPGKPVLDAEGRHKRDDRGKPVYVPIAEWTDKAVRTEFSAAIVAAVEREHPGDLQADAA